MKNQNKDLLSCENSSFQGVLPQSVGNLEFENDKKKDLFYYDKNNPENPDHLIVYLHGFLTNWKFMEEKFKTINDLLTNDNNSKNIAIAYVQGGLKPTNFENLAVLICPSTWKIKDRRAHFKFEGPIKLRIDAKDINEVKQLANDIIGGITKKYHNCKKITFIGYSQGAMLAIAIPFLIDQNILNDYSKINIIALKGGVIESLKDYIEENTEEKDMKNVKLFAIPGGTLDIIPNRQFTNLRELLDKFHTDSIIYEPSGAHPITKENIKLIENILSK